MALPRGIALIGAGSMGANHARTISQSPRSALALIVDVDAVRAKTLANQYDVPYTTNVQDVKDWDAAVIATPTATHGTVLSPLLEEGLPILVEKPLSDDLNIVEAAIALAQSQGSVLCCGFVERFNPAFGAILSMLDEPPLHIMSARHSPSRTKPMDSVVDDLLIHDLDLVTQIVVGHSVAEFGASFWPAEGAPIAEVCDCTLTFTNGSIATLSASRLGHRKLRSFQVATASRLFEADLLRADVTIYQHINQEQVLNGETISYRAATVVDIPFVRHTGEPLSLQLNHFLDLIDGTADPASEILQILPAHRLASLISGPAKAGVTR